jgi:hypothetical protein
MQLPENLQKRSLFWDVEPSGLDVEKHKKYIVERVLEYGATSDIGGLLELYSQAEMIDIIRTSRRISKKTAYFWKSYFNIKEPILCIQRRSQKLPVEHWV